jgi:hypothetical protein
MLEGLSTIQKSVVIATLILLAILTVWGGWKAIHMNDRIDLPKSSSNGA